MAEFTFRGFDLAEAIDALKAYDNGAFDSGIKDNEMREAVRSYLKGLPDDERRRVIAEVARDYGDDEADMESLYDWLGDLGVEPP